MMKRDPIFAGGDPARIWQKFCGFLTLSLPEFMEIQRGLLMEQVDLVVDSPIGKKILKDKKPGSVAEFRQQVPLTTYEDYASFLEDQKDDSLAVKSLAWAHTSGRGGKFKWIPYTERALERFADSAMAALILAAANKEGEVNLKEGSKFFSILAPRPYMSGISSWLYSDRFGLKIIPPPDIAETLEFQERIELGFQMALREGVDIIGALASTLVKMGQRLTDGSRRMGFSPYMLNPAVMARIIRAVIKSKLGKRQILPKDLWPASGFVCSGADASVYGRQLEYYWGKIPHEVYGLTEVGMAAVQSWNRKGMTFHPFSSFYEFIPEAEWLKSKENNEYQPKTVLLDEVKEGEIYDLVISNFYGMPFMRYRPGDLLKFISLDDPETGNKLPQMVFHARSDGLIDLYNIVRLDEKSIWQAIDNTGVSYEDWSARKEIEEGWPMVKIYIELKKDTEVDELQRLVHEQLMAISPLYEEAVGEVEMIPVRIKLLPPNSYQLYYEKKQKEGADLAHLKPPRMNAPDTAINDLLNLGA